MSNCFFCYFLLVFLEYITKFNVLIGQLLVQERITFYLEWEKTS